MVRRVITISILTTIFTVLLLTSCAEKQVWHTAGGAVWGTTYTIKYRSATNLDDTIIATMAHVDKTFSMFVDDSEVSRINRGETDTLSPEFQRLFTTAVRINRLSGGLYDPTVAPLVNLWGFGRKKASADTNIVEPSQSAIDSALTLVGISRCKIVDGRIIKPHPATSFDFSSIAKGYGVDLVAEALKHCGVTDFMVEIGGEVVVGGHNEHGEPWHVQIDDPTAASSRPGSAAVSLIQLGRGAVATSGNYRNYHDLKDGKRVGHIISPLTGRPITTNTLSATVIADDCMTADALATACMAMPADKALKMIATVKNTSAMLVIATGDTIQCLHTPNWQQ